METYTEEFVLKLARDAYDGDALFPIVPDRCALLVIDMQEEFVTPGWTPFWVPAATQAIPRIRALIDCCRGAGIPVIYTAFGNTHGFLDRPRSGAWMPNRFSHLGTPHDSWFEEGRIVAELAPAEGELLLYKPSYGAFYDTPLETILKNLRKDTVIICGTLTNFCCGTTARQAYERGFHVIFGSDVTASDDPALHDAELKTLRKGFARVLSGCEIADALSAAAASRA
jgi:nicotinamidase-related amidase